MNGSRVCNFLAHRKTHESQWNLENNEILSATDCTVYLSVFLLKKWGYWENLGSYYSDLNRLRSMAHVFHFDFFFKQFKDTKILIVYYACIFLFDFTSCHAICLLVLVNSDAHIGPGVINLEILNVISALEGTL